MIEWPSSPGNVDEGCDGSGSGSELVDDDIVHATPHELSSSPIGSLGPMFPGVNLGGP